jgi:hypothetical protein
MVLPETLVRSFTMSVLILRSALEFFVRLLVILVANL